MKQFYHFEKNLYFRIHNIYIYMCVLHLDLAQPRIRLFVYPYLEYFVDQYIYVTMEFFSFKLSFVYPYK